MSSTTTTTTDILLMFLSSGWCFIFAGIFIRSFYLCIRRTFCVYDDDDEEGIRSIEEEEETPERHRTMSSTRRQEKIDSLRETALQQYLKRFTLTLGDEHLLCLCGSESETDTTISTSTSEKNDDSVTSEESDGDMERSSKCSDGSVTSDESCTDMERRCDIEEGNSDVNVVLVCNGGDMAQDSKSTAPGDTAVAVEYTHISLPLPGIDVAGIDVCSIEAAQECGRQEEGKRLKITSLIQSGDDDGRETSQTEPVKITDNPNSQLQTVHKRSVPISCAICLSEYEKGDRVCWSSNAECSHVFHEDCILHWLISSGKKRSTSQYFYYTRNPPDEELLKHDFCPCCRQDFICVKPTLLGSDENV